MQTHNQYMNIIAIVIAAACLSLAAACTKEYPIEYPIDGLRIISSDSREPCENEKPLKPSQEFIRLADEQDPIEMSYPTEAYLRTLPGFDEVQDAWQKRIGSEFRRVEGVLETYRERLERYPHYDWSYPVPLFHRGETPLTDAIIVEVYLDHLVDPRTVPPEDRIPRCIAGVPVHIVVGAKFATPES